MPGLGEDGLDLNFEDLEFIHEEDVNDGTEEGTADEQEEQEGEGAESAEGSEGSGEGAAEQTEDNQQEDEGTEGVNPESVGTGATEDGEGEQTSPQLFNTLAATLKEQGVLTSVDESSLKNIKDVEDFIEVMKSQIKEQEFADLTDTQKEIVTGIREGATEDTVSQFKNAMTQLDAITPEMMEKDVNVQRDLIYQDYLSKGVSKEKAASLVERSEKGGFLASDSKEAHANLREVVTARFEASKQKDIAEKDAADRQAVKDAAALKESILESKKVMNLEVPEATRKEVYEEMMRHVSINPVTKAPENALMKYQRENPTEFSQKLYFLWKASNGFENLDYFGQKKSSSNLKDLERAIKQSTHVAGGGDPSFNDDINTSLLDIDDIIIPD